MELEDFCIQLHKLKLSNAEKALSILWFFDKEKPGLNVSIARLVNTIRDKGLGNPHSTQLKKSIEKTKLAIKNQSGFKLKPTARSQVYKWISPVFEEAATPIELQNGYLPEELWQNTRGYLEKVACQMNGCFQYGFYDAASVMMRRLIETLLIECYESKNIESRIKDDKGNYLMLSVIIKDAVDKNGLTLGRDTKKVLQEIKTMGDRAAHNRRYNAIKADLENIRLSVRLVIDELI